MSTTGHIAPPAPATGDGFIACDQCGAALDALQRYCVECGTHRADGDDPVARYLAEARRARNAPPPPSASPRVVGGGRLALAIALVPLAAAVGVMVGRGDGSDQQVLDALKVQKAPVVNVVGGAGTTAATGGAATADKTTATKAAKPSSGGKVLARTSYGTAHKLEGSKPTPSQVQESKKALKTIQNAKGREYVESQRNLPDQIVIP